MSCKTDREGWDHSMLKRAAAWLLLAVMFLTAVPSACAEKNSLVEDFTVGDWTLHGLKLCCVNASVETYIMEFAWLSSGRLCHLVITTAMHDTCESIAEQLYQLNAEEPAA